MFENIFTPSPLIWAGLLGLMVSLPFLIHLINMLRHRRVKWAAMDFLLQSYKRNRNWIWLKQLLLMLARMAALVLLLLTLGQVGCRDEQLAQFFGGQPTHHYLIIDDSYSMGEKVTGQRMFDRAYQALQLIAARSSDRANQRFTLIRYSRANLGEASVGDDDSAIADVNGVAVDRAIGDLIEQKRATVQVSDLSVGPQRALEMVEQLVFQRADEQALVYVLSDFRERDWSDDNEMQLRLKRIKDAGASLHLIDCARQSGDNLAITQLTPAGNLRVAGVPMFLELSVRNTGGKSLERVQVKLFTQEYAPDESALDRPAADMDEASELPAVFFDKIEPGETVTQQFPAYFAGVGRHIVTAILPEDGLAIDNRFDCIVDCLPSRPVLLVDDADGTNAYYLSNTFRPGQRNTGLAPTLITPEELRRLTLDDLRSYAGVYLLDPPRISTATAERLEAYVASGGGLCLFLGPRSNLTQLTATMYRNGEGMLPMPLERVVELPELVDDSQPDIVPSDHPVFALFTQSRNSLLSLVTLKKYAQPPLSWNAGDDSQVQVMARVRSERGDPLVVEKQFGKGRMTVWTTSCQPLWHDWTGNPSFVVAVLKGQEHMMSGQVDAWQSTVGRSASFPLPRDAYQPTYSVFAPAAGTLIQSEIERTAELATDAPDQYVMHLGEVSDGGMSNETSRRGVYEIHARKTDEQTDIFRWAYNLETTESELALADRTTLLDSLSELRPHYEHWDEISTDARRDLNSTFAKWFLAILIVLLIGEQVLAYLLSYHPARGGVRT